MKKFSKWYKFNDLFEYKGFTSSNNKDWVNSPNPREKKLSSAFFLEINGQMSQFNQHNGFIFKDKNNYGLKVSSIGLYFLKIFTKKTGTRVYIGLSKGSKEKHGIPARLQDHFRKIQVLPSRDKDPANKSSLLSNSLCLELARDCTFGGMGYKLAWDGKKEEFSECREELTNKDLDAQQIKKTHGIVLGKFENNMEVSNGFAESSLRKDEDNPKWKEFNKILKNIYKEDIFESEFWEKCCEISFLSADDIPDITKADIETAETKAIQALRRNFDADDILNYEKMKDPKKIHDINKDLLHESFDLNSVDSACDELILNNAKDILDKLQSANLKKCFESALEKISASNQDYYLRLTLTEDSDLRIVPTQQRKMAKNFMVFKPTRKYINCKCSLSRDELNNFFKKNNCQDFVSDINETPNEPSNIRSSFKIIGLDNNSWINALMDECFKCFDKKYPQKMIKENRTPGYGKQNN
tara:strand:- start:219 stop:1628 length:1410 start_codon:yes stop_codon:yes gene_type:complete